MVEAPLPSEIAHPLAGRVGLVTGAGQGLGKAISERLASAGALVAVNDKVPESAETTAKGIISTGGTAMVVPGDISDENQVAAIISDTVGEFGRLDMACNNAVPEVVMANLDSFDLGEAQGLVATTLLGTAICMKHEIRAMRGSGGAIVNISSTAHLRGQVGTGIYAACKAGIEALTRVAANENGRAGIRVNAVRAGAMLTPSLQPMLDSAPGIQAQVEAGIPLGHIADPAEVADVATFLLSPLARFVTGSVLTADGGGLLAVSGMTPKDS